MDPSKYLFLSIISLRYGPGFKKYIYKAGWTVDQGRCRRIESISIVDVSLLNIKPPIKK